MSNTCYLRTGVCAGVRAGAILGAMFMLCAAAIPAIAADNDLVLTGFSVNPMPLKRTCTANLSANFLINGFQDFSLASGDAEIRFYWADGGSTMPAADSTTGWSHAATLPVQWSSSDGSFAAGREWPTDFPSQAGSAASWTVPDSVTSFHLRAEVVYTAAGVTDGAPFDNYRTATVSSIDGNCSSNPNCFVVGDLMYCPPPWEVFDPEEILCMLYPDCRPRLVWDLCEICPKCCFLYELNPFERPWELVLGYPEELMHVELLVKGEVVATSRPLREPVLVGKQKFYQVLEFKMERGVKYEMRVVAGPKASPKEIYPLIMDRMSDRMMH